MWHLKGSRRALEGDGSASQHPYRAVNPPSTTSVAPVMNEDASLARKSAACAASAG